MATRSLRGPALITGASSGIGEAFARDLAARKLDLIITARRGERLEALAEELREVHGVAVDVIVEDLGVPGGAEALYAKVTGRGHDVGVLVNNAGFGLYGNSWDMELGRLKEMLQVNMTSLTALTQLCVFDMLERKSGHILQVSSVGAFQPSPLYAAYSATKAYVLSYSQALDYELRGTGVSVSTLCPGLMDSDFHKKAEHLAPKAMDGLLMSPAAAAKAGVEALLKQRPVTTPGLTNKLQVGMVAALPRRWAMAVAGKATAKQRDGGGAPAKAEEPKALLEARAKDALANKAKAQQAKADQIKADEAEAEAEAARAEAAKAEQAKAEQAPSKKGKKAKKGKGKKAKQAKAADATPAEEEAPAAAPEPEPKPDPEAASDDLSEAEKAFFPSDAERDFFSSDAERDFFG